MAFARDSRSDEAADKGKDRFGPAPANTGPTPSSLGRIIDPFAAEKAFPDPASMAEKVVFKLWSDGVVKGRSIEQARRESGDKLRLDQALTRLRLANPEDVASALAEQIGAPMAQERDFPQKPVMMDELPSRFVREALALPLADDGETLVLAMADPLDDYALRAIAMKTRRRLAVKVACANRLEAEIFRLYPLTDMRGPRALPSPNRERQASAALRSPERLPERAPERGPEPDLRASFAPATPNFVRRRPTTDRAEPAERAPQRPPLSSRERDGRREDFIGEREGFIGEREDFIGERGVERRIDRAPRRPAPPPQSEAYELRGGRSAEPAPRRGRERPAADEPSLERPLPEPSVSDDLVEETARNLARDLESDRDLDLGNLASDERDGAGRERVGRRGGERETPARRRPAERGEAAPRPSRRPAEEAVRQIARQEVARQEVARQEDAPRENARESREAPGERPAAAGPAAGMPRPKFIRPRRVTLKNKIERASVSEQAEQTRSRRAEARVERPEERAAEREIDRAAPRAEQAQSAPKPPAATPPMTTAPETASDELLAASAPGAIAAKVREQVAARRAERERAAAEGRGVGPIADEDLDDLDEFKFAIPKPSGEKDSAEGGAESPLRFGEIRGHAEAARAKTSPTRHKVLDQLRAALGFGGPASKPVEEADDRGEALRYQATSALEERGELKREAPSLRLPETEPLKRFGSAKDASARLASGAPGLTRRSKPTGGGELGVAGLSIEAAARRALDEARSVTDGLILVAGPSGSAKVETVKKLAELRARDKVEPKRFDQPGAEFPRDSSFRVYWGEIHDAESAEAAARAAMTGALVIATLDASSAPAAPGRLVGLGLPPYALASSLRAVLAQRIEEKGCTRCAETGRGAAGSACPECDGGGRVETFRISESLLLDDAMRALILSGAPEEAFRHAMKAAERKSETGAEAKPLAGRSSVRGGPSTGLRL